MMKEQTKIQGKIPDKAQEGIESRSSPTMNKKVKFAENVQQWIPIKQPSVVLDQVNNVPDKELKKVDHHGKDMK